MKKLNSMELLEQLQADARQLIVIATYLEKEDPGNLLEQPEPGRWSVTQVLEHLNSYGRYYLPAMEKSLLNKRSVKEFFRPGWLGGYFTRLMKPLDDGSIPHKMKSPRNHRPSADMDAQPVLEEFLQQQQQLLVLLEKAKTKDIGSIRTPVSISKFIRLKLGDTFRFYIAHQQRHFVQIGQALKDAKRIKDRFLVSHLVV